MMPPEQVRALATETTLEVSPEYTVAGSRCGACRRVHAPARMHRCLGCGSSHLSSERVELRGALETWTRLRSTEPGKGEWALGLVKLDAGPMLTVRVKLNGVPLRVGARVAGKAERIEGKAEQFWFEPVPTGGQPANAKADAPAGEVGAGN